MEHLAGMSNRFYWLRVGLFFCVLTVIFTLPAVMHLKSEIIGQPGDNVYFIWLIGWFKKALFDLHVNPFNIWFLNYPQGWNLAFTEITPLMLLIALPFSFLAGPGFGYNIAMLLTFVLAGLGMFIWVHRLTQRTDAALLAGTVYAFLPFHLAQYLIGHLNLASIQWFPFYFMGLQEILGLFPGQTPPKDVPRQAIWKPAILAGCALGFIALTSIYYVYMALIVSAWMVAVFLVKSKARWDLHVWARLLGFITCIIPFILLAVFPYFQLMVSGGLPERNLEVVRRFSASASPTDYILPSTDHFVWGAFVNEHFDRSLWAENTLYIGLPAGVLALLGWIFRKKLDQSTWLNLAFWGGLLAFLLSLGPDLLWLNERISIIAPQFLQSILGRTEFHIPLPGYLFFKFFPFYSRLRAFSRFGIFVLVFTSLSAGLGTAWLLSRFAKKRQIWVTWLLILLVLMDFFPGLYREFSKVEPRPVDAWLAEQTGMGAVAQFPFHLAEDQEQVFYTLTHGKPFIGGFFNAFPPEQYLRIQPVLQDFPSESGVALLDELGVQYILLDANQYENINQVILHCQQLGLHLKARIKDEVVIEFAVDR